MLKKRKLSNKVRIIGGRWRGRKISFPDLADLRPTGDRIRETLFNWLADVIDGAYCLDLFAGSGALGFEALSRGAGKVVMVDSEPQIIASLQANQEALGAENLEIIQMDAEEYILSSHGNKSPSSRGATLSSRGLTAGSSEQAPSPQPSPASGRGRTDNDGFDIIFLDPPFKKRLIPKFCQLIAEKNLLKLGGYIYIETDAALDDLPKDWQIIKQKQAGKVLYYLYTR